MRAQMHVWEGAIPLQIRLHESEVTTHPPPSPALILGQRLGYLPLLIPLVKPYFASTLPPGNDTVWFDYNGLPLKWYIPIGVLFDLLCAEPERPWNLTVHFRGYPNNLLIPCEGEDTVKWSFINSLKEADYIINGNCKNVMNMSQTDQLELWRSVMNGNLEAYRRASSKLKLGTIEDEFTMKSETSPKSRKTTGEVDMAGAGKMKTGKIPVRLYVWTVSEDFEDLEDIPKINSWDKISYINRPVDIPREEGKFFTLRDALKALLPEYLLGKPLNDEKSIGVEDDNKRNLISEEKKTNAKEVDLRQSADAETSSPSSSVAEIKIVRIQGIEPKLEIPFSWVANNLKNPEHFLHICVCLKFPSVKSLESNQ